MRAARIDANQPERAKPRTVRLLIPEPTPLLNVWQRMHWQKRRKVCERFSLMVRQALGYPWTEPPIEKCLIHIERHSAGLPDWDGLYGGTKPILDALVVPSKRNPHGRGIIRDDNPAVVLTLTALPVVCKRKEGYTVVHIYETGDGVPHDMGGANDTQPSMEANQ